MAPRLLTVHVDSCHVLATDHEILEGSFRVRAARAHRRHSTKPRVWTGGIDRITLIDQSQLEWMAQKFAKPKPGSAYEDPPQVKRAALSARVLKTASAWREVRKLRKQALKEWELQRVAKATHGD